MKQTMMALTALLFLASVAVAQSNIDPANKFAWSENVGWTNWRGEAIPGQGVIVHATFLEGFIWAENVGWINTGDGTPDADCDGIPCYNNFDHTGIGVNLLADGTLCGYAWGENVGWINFDGGLLASPPNPARIENGRLRGYAWGENIGWINLDDATHFVGLISATVTIASANPPSVSPYDAAQRFRDPLQTGATSALTQGIGAAGTPDQGPVHYSPISVTFSAAISPAPTPGNIMLTCTDVTGNGAGDCPAVTAVSAGPGANEFLITLSGAIPPRECVTFTFAGTSAGEKLQYQSLPADVSLDGSSNTSDLLALVTALNNGSANQSANLARFNVDRSGGVNTQDLLRTVQLLNGISTTQVFNGATVAPCP